jgi:hypothetical protein
MHIMCGTPTHPEIATCRGGDRFTKLSYAPDYRLMHTMRGDAAHPES